MPLQSIPINFAQGVNTKADPWQVPLGQFLSLENSVFTVAGQLKKRNGYGIVTTIPDAATITTYSSNLIGLGTNTLMTYSQDTKQVQAAGYNQPLSISTLPAVRRASGQTTVDSAISSNGLLCSVWQDSDGSAYYQINDSENSSTIVSCTSLNTGTDSAVNMPRVFAIGNYIIIIYLATVSAQSALRYVAIPILNPKAPLAPAALSTQVSSLTAAYDGIVVATNPGTLYVAWNGSDVGGAVRIVPISSTLAVGSTTVLAGAIADLISVSWDTLLSNLWITYYTASANSVSGAAFNQSLTQLLAPTVISSSVTLHNGLTATATAGILTAFYEVSNFYGYDSSLRTDYVGINTCTLAGVPGTPSVLLRGIGLSSKAAYIAANDKSYVLATYSSAYQPTYFLIDNTGNIVAKLAYSNGGGYSINQILPQLNISTSALGQPVIQVGYLFKDFLASIANPVGPLAVDTGTNKTQGAANSVPIYSQTGINLATFTFGAPVPTAETGGILHLGEGFPWMFDGVKPVEHQFHLWPDAVECSSANSGGGISAQQYFYQAIYYWIDGQGNPQMSAPSVPVTVTAIAGSFGAQITASSGSTTLNVGTGLSSLFVGQIVTNTNIPAGTYIVSINTAASTVVISQATTGAITGTSVMDTVDTATNTVYVPTLRLTSKWNYPTNTGTANKVIIKIYRWSTANQVYYEVTSVKSPTYNDPTADYITFTDKQNDLAIIGNSLIYTTGGVVEDIAAPSFSVSTMFDDRLWVLDAEDPYTLWYSKQVLPGTGVEFSDLFTYYVAPTTGAQGSTGPLTALCPMDTELVMFKKDAMYYLNGAGPDNTGANSTYSQPIYISSTVGCANPNSLVLMDQGIMFQSDKGIWLLGRNLQPNYIGQVVEQYVLGNKVTSATVVPGTTQVRFTLDTGITLLYDYLYNQWGTFSNIPAISATLYQGLHTYLNKFGQVLQETPGKYLDISTPVLLQFTTNWIQLQGLSGYQRLIETQILGQYLSPHTLDIQFAYDFGEPIDQVEIQPLNSTGAYGSDALYGQTTLYGGPAPLEQWRIQPSTQKCQAFQMRFQEIYDPSKGFPAGAGLTLSAFTAVVLLNRGYRPVKAVSTAGTS